MSMIKMENYEAIDYFSQKAEINAQSSLTDYIPRHVLQEIQDSLSDLLHVPILFATQDGSPITRSAVLSTFCYRFVHKSNARRPCLQCTRFNSLNDGDNLVENNVTPSQNDCPTGLCDITVPIILNSTVLGYLITSQLIGSNGVRISAYRLLRQNGMDGQTARNFISSFPTTSTEVMAKIGRSIVSIVSVISSLASSYAANARLAIYDALTELFNRAYMWEFLNNQISRSRNSKKPFSIIVLDLDGFKIINDTYGHSAGDAVLKEVAKSLKLSIRPGDLPARFGGDEFVIILSNVGKKRAMMISERIQENISKLRVTYNNQSLNIAASIGIAVFSKNCSKTSEQLFAVADRMLYLDKNKKRTKNAA